MRAVLFALFVGCAPTVMQMTPDDPANPDAPVGRLAGPPPALRPGVAAASAPEPPSSEHAGHEHGASTPQTEPTTTGPKTEPEAPKPTPKAPAKKPSKPMQPPASSPAPAPKTPAPAPESHEGHHH
jgi:hypothetical protein